MEIIECIESNKLTSNLIELFFAYKTNNPFIKKIILSVCIAVIIHCYCWGQLLGFVVALIILCIILFIQFIKLLITKRRVHKSKVNFYNIIINQHVMVDNNEQYDLKDVTSYSSFRNNIGLLINNRIFICKVKSKEEISYIKKIVSKTNIKKKLFRNGILILIGLIIPLTIFSIANIIYKNKLDNLINEFSSRYTNFSVNYVDDFSNYRFTVYSGRNYIKLYKSLTIIYDEINNLPEGFLEEISDTSIVCLCKYIYDSLENSEVSGFFSIKDDYNVISVNSYYPFMTKEVFDHELFHYIENTNFNITIVDNKVYLFKGFSNWRSFNPQNYNYGVEDSQYIMNINAL